MKLSDAIDIVKQTALNAATDDTFPKREIINAIRFVGEEFCRETAVVRKSGTVDTTADTSLVSAASLTAADGGTGPYTDFRPERLIRAEIQYDDQGTWTVSTAYTKNQLVQGDGSPDSKYYVCKLAHTSSANDEPGGSGDWSQYWRRVQWERSDSLNVVDFKTMIDRLESVQLDHEWVNPPLTSAEPVEVAFDYGTQNAYLWPVPDTVYTLRLTYRSAFTDVTTGDPTLNIPDEYIMGVLWWGVPAALQHTAPENGYANDAWAKYRQFVREVKGDVGFESRSLYTREDEVL